MNNELQDNQHYTYRTLSQPTMLLGLPFRVMLTYVLTTFILFILLAMLKLITVWIVILMVLTYFVLRLLFGEDKFFFKAFKSNLKYVKGNSISNIISANIV